MTSLPGYSKLELADVLEGTAAQLVQLVIDAVKSGKKKVGLWRSLPWSQLEVAACHFLLLLFC